MFRKKKKLKEGSILFVVALLLIGGYFYYEYFFTPKNSLELYQEITFADSVDEVQKLFLRGYEVDLTEEDLNYMRGHSANRVSQFTLFEYNSKSYVIMTSPGTKKLKVLAIEELPEQMRSFFSELYFERILE